MLGLHDVTRHASTSPAALEPLHGTLRYATFLFATAKYLSQSLVTALLGTTLSWRVMRAIVGTRALSRCMHRSLTQPLRQSPMSKDTANTFLTEGVCSRVLLLRSILLQVLRIVWGYPGIYIPEYGQQTGFGTRIPPIVCIVLTRPRWQQLDLLLKTGVTG